MSILVEVVVIAADARSAGIDSRDEIEDVLEEALQDSGWCEVSGGGGGVGLFVIDVDIRGEEFVQASLGLIRESLQSIGVPRSTVIKRYRPEVVEYPVYT